MALAIGLLAPAKEAQAAPSPPAVLEVAQGAGWSAEGRFDLRWKNPAGGAPIVAVHYRVLDPLGSVVLGPRRIDWATERVDGVRVGAAPGVYTAEVWLEDAGGGSGQAATARMRFDRTPPGPSKPLPVAGLGESQRAAADGSPLPPGRPGAAVGDPRLRRLGGSQPRGAAMRRPRPLHRR